MKNVRDSSKVEEIQLNLRKRWKIAQRKSLATAGLAQWNCWEFPRQSKSDSQGMSFWEGINKV